MRNVKIREVKVLAPGHTAIGWQSQNVSPHFPDPAGTPLLPTRLANQEHFTQNGSRPHDVEIGQSVQLSKSLQERKWYRGLILAWSQKNPVQVLTLGDSIHITTLESVSSGIKVGEVLN